jgi:hypothetical protein
VATILNKPASGAEVGVDLLAGSLFRGFRHGEQSSVVVG